MVGWRWMMGWRWSLMMELVDDGIAECRRMVGEWDIEVDDGIVG